MRNYKIHFIRNGKTELNNSGAFGGCRNDVGISTDGIKELIDLKETYDYPPVSLVYTSPMSSCLETAGIIYPDRELVVVPPFKEMDFGDFSGHTIDELKDDDNFKEWLKDAYNVAPPNGESGMDFTLRLVDAFKWLVNDMMKSETFDAAVITHGGAITTLLSGIGIPKKAPNEWMVGNGKGYTCYLNAQMWMTGGIIEVAGIAPYGVINPLFEFGEEK